jgi:hypothetical protein
MLGLGKMAVLARVIARVRKQGCLNLMAALFQCLWALGVMSGLS